MRWRDQLPADADAVGRRSRRASAGTRHRSRRRRAGRGREPAGPPRGLHPVQEPATRVGRALHEDVAPPVRRRRMAPVQEGPGRDEPLRGRRVRAQQRGRRLPEPDVPLPADRDPLRRLGAGGRPRLPGAHRPDVLGRARHRSAQERRPDGAPGAAIQLSVDRAGSPRVGRGDPRRPRHPEPAGDGARSTAARSHRGRASTPTNRSASGSRATARPPCTRRARRRWAMRPTRCRWSTR